MQLSDTHAALCKTVLTKNVFNCDTAYSSRIEAMKPPQRLQDVEVGEGGGRDQI